MDHAFKVAISHCQWGGVSYQGFGRGDRQYAIHKDKNHYFTASFISGEGQPITAVGRSPMEAVARAESLQEDGMLQSADPQRPARGQIALERPVTAGD